MDKTITPGYLQVSVEDASWRGIVTLFGTWRESEKNSLCSIGRTYFDGYSLYHIRGERYPSKKNACAGHHWDEY